MTKDDEENGHDLTSKPYGAVKHAYDDKKVQNSSQEVRDKIEEEDSPANDKTFVATENLKLPIGMLTVKIFRLLILAFFF